MHGLTKNADDGVECPLCMEPLEVDDLNFYPCTCGYQICRFCWHRIRTDENELCPACRKAYPENPADFTPLTQEEIIAFKSQKRQRDQQRKQQITENRKHLSNVRVVQKNLVFVVGLPPRLADADILKKHEYFGKYGKIHKVVINPSTTYAGVQGPSASAYVTYVNSSDALRAIQSVNNINIDGRPIKTSLGTTKYCSHFMKNQQCPKSDCMYLHELGDLEASFTKEEMHQGKHQEYEKRLHETLLLNLAVSSNGPNQASGGAATAFISNSTAPCTAGQNKEAWPSLSVSPPNNKEITALNAKTKKERMKTNEKLKIEKSVKVKSKINTSCNNAFNRPNNGNVQVSRDEGCLMDSSMGIPKKKTDKMKQDKFLSPSGRDMHNYEKKSIHADSEVQSVKASENINHSADDTLACDSNRNHNSCRINSKNGVCIKNADVQRSLSASSNASIASGSSNSSRFEGRVERSEADENSRKSEGGSPFYTKTAEEQSRPSEAYRPANCEQFDASSATMENFSFENQNDINGIECSDLFTTENPFSTLKAVNEFNLNDTTAAISNLNLFEDNNSLFSLSPPLNHSLLLNNKLEAEIRKVHKSNSFISQLPDLLDGIDGFKTGGTNLNEINNIGNNSCNNDEINATSQTELVQRQMHQPQTHQPGRFLGNNAFGIDMSKFFDFHKNQQQVNQFVLNRGIFNIPTNNGSINDHHRATDHVESNRFNSPFLDQCDNHAQPPSHLQKQILRSGAPQSQKMPQPNHQQKLQSQQKQNGVSKNFLQKSFVDDDLGFDPFIETQKALAELMENELNQQQHMNVTAGTNNMLVKSKSPEQQLSRNDHMQRSRLPPPGFNHHTNVARIGMPRMQHANNVLPIVNAGKSVTGNTICGGWKSHWAQFSQHELEHFNKTPNNQLTESLNAESQRGYCNNDWTAMDPAILSFRQFSFPQQSLVPNSSFQKDLYVHDTMQQENPQGSQINCSNVNLANNIMMNLPQNSVGQVNANVQGMLEYLKTRQFM